MLEPIYAVEDDNDYSPTRVCSFCHRGNLVWEQEINGKYILVDANSGRVHNCRTKQIPINLDMKVK